MPEQYWGELEQDKLQMVKIQLYMVLALKSEGLRDL